MITEQHTYAAQCIESGDFAKAHEVLTKLLAYSDTDVNALYLMGTIHSKADHHGLARLMYRRITELEPNKPEAWNNLGMCTEAIGDTTEARALFHRAWKMRPNAIHAGNIALTHLQEGEHEKALYWCDRAFAYDASSTHAKLTQGFCNLAAGKWESGWKGFAYSLGSKYRPDKGYELPMWEGKEGQHVVIYGDQGIGDEIMYASCIPDAAAKCASVMLDTDPKLAALFTESFGHLPNVRVVGTRDRARGWVNDPRNPLWDAAISLAGLPELFRPTPKSCPGKPYLKADPDLEAMYDGLLTQHDRTIGAKRVGICWRAGGPLTGAKRRHIDLETLRPLVDALHDSGCTVYSLNYQPGTAAEIKASGLPIKHFHYAVGKGAAYDQTAAFISRLDHVVGVDTTAQHAAGALGVPASVLLHTAPMWNFGDYQGDKFCWYESTRLFRQLPENALQTEAPQKTWAQMIKYHLPTLVTRITQ